MYKKTWWLNPRNLYIVLLMIVFEAFKTSSEVYRTQYSCQKGIDVNFLMLHFLTFIFFCAGLYLAKKRRYSGVIFTPKIVDKFYDNKINLKTLYAAYRLLYAVCIISYSIWYLNFIRINGISILKSFVSQEAISSAMYTLRNNSGQISGITTFTEIGVIVMPIGVLLYKNNYKEKIRIELIVLILLALFRTVAFSERLALFELLIPAIVSYVAYDENYKHGLIIKVGPMIAVIGLLVLFGIFEYPRSWLRFYVNYYDSYVEFVVQRVLGYYTNAINTECLYLTYAKTSLIPYRSIEWFWKIPGIDMIYNCLTEFSVPKQFYTILLNRGNLEYNNPGGMLTFVVDFGMLYPLFQMILGFIIGRTYRLFLKNNYLGVVLYSYFYMCLLDLPRYSSFSSQRTFCVFVGVLILIWKVKESDNVKNPIVYNLW